MSEYNRRSFLKKSAGLAAAAGIAPVIGGCPQRRKSATADDVKWRYAMCNEMLTGLSWPQQCQVIGEAGFAGVEIGTFSLVKENVAELTPTKRKEMLKTMQDNGLACAGLHWLLAPPPPGLHITTPDKAVRTRTIAYLEELIDWCADLGGPIMVFGSPKQRGADGISLDEARKHLADGLAAIADKAQSRGVMVLLEPLDSTQTNVVNTTAEAMEIVNRVNHPAIQTMFDFHNTLNETEPFDVIIRKYYQHIHHVHVQEMDGSYLGTGDAATAFVPAFQTLKDLGFSKWVSVEVFDASPGARTITFESMKVLRQIESQLT